MESEMPGEIQDKSRPKYKILVVDDSDLVRKLVVNVLSDQGHQCLTAGDGADALNKAHQIKFDAVITDIVMPVMNGIRLTRELLRLQHRLPIMIMTAYSQEYPTELAIAAGAREFIGKPFRNDEFVLRFNKMMRDQEISHQIDAKQRDMLFRVQKESAEKIEELQREIKSLTGRLSSGWRDSQSLNPGLHPFLTDVLKR